MGHYGKEKEGHERGRYNNSEICLDFYFMLLCFGAFSVLTLLLWQQEGHSACEN